MRAIARDLIADRIRAVFNDRGRGEAPVRHGEDGLIPPGSVAWRVHGDVMTMMVGGVSALLLQMLHPAVLAGVWDHSRFRDNMLGRLRRTARFIAVTTYGGEAEALAAIERVRFVHRHVRGTLPDGTPYRADDPELLTWVHVTETRSFLNARIRFREPFMSLAEQDRYFAETAVVARHLGASDVPESRASTLARIERMRPELRVDHRTREVAHLLLHAEPPGLAKRSIQRLISRAATDLLPGWARQMHTLSASTLTRPMVTGGTYGLAEAAQWALRR